MAPVSHHARTAAGHEQPAESVLADINEIKEWAHS